MSVATSTAKISYTLTTGSQALAVPFYFLENSHIKAIKAATSTDPKMDLVLGTDYTLSGAANPAGGTLTTIATVGNGLVTGSKVVIKRNVPFDQLITYTFNDAFPSKTHEKGLDKGTMLAQQLKEQADRAIQLPEDDAGSGVLPSATDRAMGAVVFDENGALDVVERSQALYTAGDAITVPTVVALRAHPYANVVDKFPINLGGYNATGDGGGGTLYVDKADTTTADNAFSVFVANDGTRLKREKCQSYDVRMAGVRMDGTDSTVRLQACAAYSMANGCIFDLPEGTINCTGNLDFGSSVAPTFGVGPKFRGAGRDATTLRCTAANVPIIKFGGSFGLLTGLTVTYSAQQSVAQTNAAAIRFYAAQWFVISDVAINNSFTPFDIYQGAVVSGANYIFSCSIRDVRIVGFTGYVMQIIPYNGGCMGVSISNVWANYPTGTALGGYVFTGMSDSVITAIDVENVTIPRALYVSGCTAISINGMHIELATITGTFDGLFTFDGGSNAVLNNIRVLNCTFSATTRSYLFRISSSASLSVAAVNASAITITTAVKLLETDSAADNSFEAVNLVVPDFVGYDLAGPTTVVKRVNDNVISLTRGFEGLRQVIAAVAPTTGAWAVGEIAWNLFAAPTGYVGWVCTTAGTPGTWKGFGVIQA